jgi:hypothetical protein
MEHREASSNFDNYGFKLVESKKNKQQRRRKQQLLKQYNAHDEVVLNHTQPLLTPIVAKANFSKHSDQEARSSSLTSHSNDHVDEYEKQNATAAVDFDYDDDNEDDGDDDDDELAKLVDEKKSYLMHMYARIEQCKRELIDLDEHFYWAKFKLSFNAALNEYFPNFIYFNNNHNNNNNNNNSVNTTTMNGNNKNNSNMNMNTNNETNRDDYEDDDKDNNKNNDNNDQHCLSSFSSSSFTYTNANITTNNDNTNTSKTNNSNNTNSNLNYRVNIYCYGIGSIEDNLSSRYQFTLLLLIIDHLRSFALEQTTKYNQAQSSTNKTTEKQEKQQTCAIKADACHVVVNQADAENENGHRRHQSIQIGRVELYDPIMSVMDKQLVKYVYKLNIAEKNTRCVKTYALVGSPIVNADDKTKNNNKSSNISEDRLLNIIYMPHCPKALYNNLLYSNWCEQSLSRIMLIGNSLIDIRTNTLDQVMLENYAYIYDSTEMIIERRLENECERTDAFHSMCISTFKPDKQSSNNSLRIGLAKSTQQLPLLPRPVYARDDLLEIF